MKIIRMFTFFIFVFLVASINITYIHQNKIDNLNSLSNGFYSDSAVFFIPSENILDNESLLYFLPDRGALYVEMTSSTYNIIGIIHNDGYVLPDVFSDNFFDVYDYKNNARLALVGRNVEIHTVEDVEFIELDGIRYDVIGKLGYKFPTRLDFSIILSVNEKMINHNIHKYVVDGSSLQEHFDFLGHEEFVGNVTVHRPGNMNILNIIDSGNIHFVVSIFFILMLILNSIIIFFIFVEKMTYELKVKKTIGFSNKSLVVHESIRILKLIALSFLCGNIISIIFSFIRYENVFLINLVFINFILILVALLYVYWLLRRKLQLISI